MKRKRPRSLGATGVNVVALVRARERDLRYLAKLSDVQLRKNLCFDASSTVAPSSLGRRIAEEALREHRAEARRRGWTAARIRFAERCRGHDL